MKWAIHVSWTKGGNRVKGTAVSNPPCTGLPRTPPPEYTTLVTPPVYLATHVAAPRSSAERRSCSSDRGSPERVTVAFSADMVQSGGLVSCSIQPQMVSRGGTAPESGRWMRKGLVAGGSVGEGSGVRTMATSKQLSTKIYRRACSGVRTGVCVRGGGS